MLNYLLPQRNNWLKLKTLVSWSEKAGLVRDYEVKDFGLNLDL
jgi:hypothetical protein